MYSFRTDASVFTRRYSSGIRNLQFQIINTLRLGEREKASRMLFNFANANDALSAENFSHILEYCAQTPDPMFVLETWSVMVGKSIAINKQCLRSIIKSLSKGGYLKEARNWLSYVGDSYSSAPLPIYNSFLHACVSARSIVDADYCLELMEKNLVGKSEVTYYELLKLAVLQKNVYAVHEIWKDCTKYYEPSIISLRKFIWSFTRLGDLQSAYNALQRLVALASLEGASTLRTSTAGRYQSSKLDIPIPLLSGSSSRPLSLDGSCNTKQFLQGSLKIDHKEEIEPPNTPGNREILDNIVSNPYPELDGNGAFYSSLRNMKAEVEWGSMMDRGFGFDVRKKMASIPLMNILRWSFNDLIHACSHSNNCELAEQLFFQMHVLGVEPSPHTYDGYVKAVINEKGVARGLEMIKALEKWNVKANNSTLAAIVILLSKNLELDSAEEMLAKFSNCLQKHIHPFNTFLAFCRVAGEPERALRMLAKMRHLNIKLNVKTYELLIALFGNVNAPYEKGDSSSRADVLTRINTIELDMMKNEIQHNYASMKNLISALGAEGMLPEMLQYLKLAENLLWQANPYQRTAINNVVLHSLVKAKECGTAIELFKSMRLLDFPANIATYNIMIECCSILECFRSARALVSVMIRDGYRPQLLTYTALIKVLLSYEDFDRVLHVLGLLSSDGIHPDIQLFNTILKVAHLKGLIDKIEFIIEHIHREKILPDPSTCWYTFCAYVEGGFDNTALEALKVLSVRMISEDRNFLKNMDFYEDLVYEEDDREAVSEMMKIFEDSNVFLATALLNLRMCAISGFSVSLSSNNDTSYWARRLSSSYDARRTFGRMSLLF